MFQGPTARVLTGAAAAVAGLALATPAWAASGASLSPSRTTTIGRRTPSGGRFVSALPVRT